MAKEKNTLVCLDSNHLDIFARLLHQAYNNYMGKKITLSSYKESDNYYKLSEAIENSTTIKISPSTLRNIITNRHGGKFQRKVFDAINYFINENIKGRDNSGIETVVLSKPIKQNIYWGPNQDLKAGVFVDKIDGIFIPWKTIKTEIEQRVIPQCPRKIAPNAKIAFGSFYGKKDWTVNVETSNGEYIYSIWLKSNPMKGWKPDGLVRLGFTHDDLNWDVWQVFQRYSDGSYRIVKSFV